MKIIKKIDFFGSFEKADAEDTQPIEGINAVLCCYDNGLVLLEAEQEIINSIEQKRLIESSPLYGFKKDTDELKSQQILDEALFLFNIKKGDLEIIRSSYDGNYIIKGENSEGLFVSAIVSEDSRRKPKLILQSLKINSNIISSKSQVQRVTYGLTQLKLFPDFSASIHNWQSSFYIAPVQNDNQEILDATLTAEMTLCDLPTNEDYQHYSTWLTLLLSFASGSKVNIIYEFTTYRSNNKLQFSEYWLGSMPDSKKGGIAVIQRPHLAKFFHQVSKSLNFEFFDEKGIGLALFWYLESWETNVVNTQFICLCTAIESLIKNYSDTINSRLLSTAKYREIRDSILKILQEKGDDLAKTNDSQEKYDIFYKKVKQIFEEGGLNKIGNLGAALQEMLQFYQVYYKDLFPNFDFIKLRNDLVHKGFSEVDEMYETFLKLENLFIRIVLSMLKYEGDYMEHNGTQLICRSFPLSDDA
jgi:hypothetical protein